MRAWVSISSESFLLSSVTRIAPETLSAILSAIFWLNTSTWLSLKFIIMHQKKQYGIKSSTLDYHVHDRDHKWWVHFLTLLFQFVQEQLLPLEPIQCWCEALEYSQQPFRVVQTYCLNLIRPYVFSWSSVSVWSIKTQWFNV